MYERCRQACTFPSAAASSPEGGVHL